MLKIYNKILFFQILFLFIAEIKILEITFLYFHQIKVQRPDVQKVLAPQIFNDDVYLGDYENFFNANEIGLKYTFFKLDAPEGSREAKALKRYKAQGIEIKF